MIFNIPLHCPASSHAVQLFVIGEGKNMKSGSGLTVPSSWAGLTVFLCAGGSSQVEGSRLGWFSHCRKKLNQKVLPWSTFVPTPPREAHNTVPPDEITWLLKKLFQQLGQNKRSKNKMGGQKRRSPAPWLPPSCPTAEIKPNSRSVVKLETLQRKVYLYRNHSNLF